MNVMKVFFLQVAVQYYENLHDLLDDLLLLPKRIKIEKVVANVYD